MPRNKLLLRALSAGAAILAMGSAAMAASPYDVITDAVDFTAVSPVVYAVAGALAGIYVIIKGVKVALAFVRS